MSCRIVPVLEDRPLSVIRVHRGQAPFMQKNVPKYTPEWVRTVPLWAETSKREVSYALCNDRRTLLWFANQRAVEYHPTLVTIDRPDRVTHLVLDLDPPEGNDSFPLAVRAAQLVRQALDDAGLQGAVKTSGAKGVHVFVPVDDEVPLADSAAATRAIAVRAERLDPDLATTEFMKEDRGGKVFLDATRVGRRDGGLGLQPAGPPGRAGVLPGGVGRPRRRLAGATSRCAPRPTCSATATRGPSGCRPRRPSRGDLIDEGHAIPTARVQAMHEGKRRARARRKES